MEEAEQNVIKTQSELEYAKYEKQRYRALAGQGAGWEAVKGQDERPRGALDRLPESNGDVCKLSA